MTIEIFATATVNDRDNDNNLVLLNVSGGYQWHREDGTPIGNEPVYPDVETAVGAMKQVKGCTFCV